MIINLEGTTSAKISAELIRVRRSAGSPAQGMVLTLIIVCDESEFPSSRILRLLDEIPRRGEPPAWTPRSISARARQARLW